MIIFIVAAFLRFYKLEEFITFLGDQGRDAIIVKRIVTFEHLPAIGAPSSIGQIFLGPFYYYLIAPFLLLFGFEPMGLAFGVAILTLVGMAVGYYILQKEVNKTTALGFLLFVTFTASLIELSRFSWNPNLLPVFSFFTLYFFAKMLDAKGFDKKRIAYAAAFGSFFCLAFQLHHLTGLLALTFLIIGIYKLIKTPGTKEKIQLLKLSGVSLAGFVFFYMPLILFDLKNRFINIISLVNLFTGKESVKQTAYFLPFIDTTQAFFQFLFRVPFNLYTTLALFIVLLALAIVTYKQISKNTLILVHTVTIFVYLIAFSRLYSQRHVHYYGAIFFSFFVFVAFLISLLPKALYRNIGLAVATAAIILLNAPGYRFLFIEGSNQIGYARTIAESFKGKIQQQPIQMVADPQTETDGHFRYFLEKMGYKILPYESIEQAPELYLVCFDPKCGVIGNPQWQVAMFSKPKIADKWQVKNVTIYKLVHEQ